MGESPTRMACTIEQHDLLDATQFAVKRVGKDPTDPILGGMLLESYHGGAFAVTAFDRDVSHSMEISRKDIDEQEGVVLVSGRKLAELVKTFPHKPVHLEERDTTLVIVCGPVRCTLPLMPAEDYPSLPATADPIGTIAAPVLREHVERVLSAADTKGDAAKPALTGIHCIFDPGVLRLTATNGYRVGMTKAPWSSASGMNAPWVALVPWAVLGDFARTLDTDAPVTVGLTDTVISLTGQDRTVVARMLNAGEYPKFKGLSPKGDPPTTVDVSELQSAIKRAVLALEPKEPVTLAFDSDTVAVHGGREADDRSAVSTGVACKHAGPPITVTINPDYLGSALDACRSGVAELTLTDDARKPVLITVDGVDGFGWVIMPIRKSS
jgi:DNA polymerase-3 subunit beta